MERKELLDKKEIVNFKLNNAILELEKIQTNTFAYNPNIEKLVQEIKILKETLITINDQLEEVK